MIEIYELLSDAHTQRARKWCCNPNKLFFYCNQIKTTSGLNKSLNPSSNHLLKFVAAPIHCQFNTASKFKLNKSCAHADKPFLLCLFITATLTSTQLQRWETMTCLLFAPWAKDMLHLCLSSESVRSSVGKEWNCITDASQKLHNYQRCTCDTGTSNVLHVCLFISTQCDLCYIFNQIWPWCHIQCQAA